MNQWVFEYLSFSSCTIGALNTNITWEVSVPVTEQIHKLYSDLLFLNVNAYTWAREKHVPLQNEL